MIITCHCGARFKVPESLVGQDARCSKCHGMLTLVAATRPFTAAMPGDFEARLIVEAGPEYGGQQFLLGGQDPITMGKLEGKVVLLPGQRVSRNHCRLIRGHEARWTLEDEHSTNGSLVNGERVQVQELHNGDEICIGEYRLRYVTSAVEAKAAVAPVQAAAEQGGSGDEGMVDLSGEGVDLYDVAEPPPPAHQPSVPFAVHGQDVAVATAQPVADGPVCPSCEQRLPRNTKICVGCGINIRTGRPLLLSQGLDEDELHVRAENTIRVISWLLPVGPFYPIASEAFGTVKPHVTRAIAIVTLLTSVLFWVNGCGVEDVSELPGRQYMLWPQRDVQAAKARIEKERAAMQMELQRRRGTTSEKEVRQQILLDELRLQAEEEELETATPFRWYQLVTHAFLHGGILHIAGNLLFLMVFGSRVNALIGNIATGILYPILAVAAAFAHLWFEVGDGVPMLGASGAIMGLAGMYFILFPIHKVYMAAWWRLGLFTGFRLMFTVWAMRGFWVVGIYISFDVIATMMGSQDGTAHWAHLGGFVIGMGVALALLCSRLLNARGGDILSVCLGKLAWPILGKPSRWKEAV